jgi:hypothetical protein
MDHGEIPGFHRQKNDVVMFEQVLAAVVLLEVFQLK